MEFSGILAEIAVAAGEDAALAVARAKGGARAYIPGTEAIKSSCKKSNWLVDLVGREAALKISDALLPGRHGMAIAIPLGPMDYRRIIAGKIDALLDEGKGANEISRTLHVSRSTIFARRKARATANVKTKKPIQTES